MGFFDALRRALGGDYGSPDRRPFDRPAGVWGLDDDEESGIPTPESDLNAEAGAYDRKNWHRKLKRVLDRLPDSQQEWPDLMSEARALNLDHDWVKQCQREEFLLLVRRAVSDRLFTEEEHRKLDQARDLIGIPEEEAEASLHAIMAEAAQFFGKPVQEE